MIQIKIVIVSKNKFSNFKIQIVEKKFINDVNVVQKTQKQFKKNAIKKIIRDFEKKNENCKNQNSKEKSSI